MSSIECAPRNLYFYILFVTFFVCLGGVSIASAQSIPTGTSASLITTPPYPEPHSVVKVSLDAYMIDTTGARITWYVDGKVQSDAQNERSLEVLTGALGTSQVVRAEIVSIGGFPLNVSHTISPTRIDLITEASTYVPPFYKGKALPVENLPVRVIALPHSGSDALPTTFTYQWTLDDTVLFGGPIKGKYAIDITVPQYPNHELLVVVSDSKGRLVGESRTTLSGVAPELYFYEYSALKGLNSRALMNETTIIGDEMTVYGEPYYTASDISPQSVEFTWRINGERVDGGEDPHTLTLRKTGGGGNARIELEALTKSQVPKYLQKEFTLMF